MINDRKEWAADQVEAVVRVPAAVNEVCVERCVAVEEILAEINDELVCVPQCRLHNRPICHPSITRHYSQRKKVLLRVNKKVDLLFREISRNKG
jgi:hypothetical protein